MLQRAWTGSLALKSKKNGKENDLWFNAKIIEKVAKRFLIGPSHRSNALCRDWGRDVLPTIEQIKEVRSFEKRIRFRP